MDVVLTDPRVSRRHAVFRLEGPVLSVEDLGSSGGTAVNGVTIAAPTALAAGDRVALGSTELTVLWTPAGALAPASPPEPEPEPEPKPEPAPAPVATAPEPERDDPADLRARPEVLIAFACLALSVLALLCVWVPVVGDASGTDSAWSLDPAGLRLQGVLAALVAGAAAGAWLRAATDERRAALRLPLAAITAGAGGLVAGLPLFLSAVDTGAASRELGLVVYAIAGIALVVGPIAGVARIAGERRDAPLSAGAVLLVASGGAVGGLVVTVASPLAWISSGFTEYGGFDATVGAGGWLVVLSLGTVVTSVLALAVARAGDRRAALYFATCAAALSAASFTFSTAAAFLFEDFQMEVGLSLILTGSAIALTCTAIGAITLALEPPEEAGVSPG